MRKIVNEKKEVEFCDFCGEAKVMAFGEDMFGFGKKSFEWREGTWARTMVSIYRSRGKNFCMCPKCFDETLVPFLESKKLTK